MSRKRRSCDRCGRPIRGKPGIIDLDNIFCSLACKRRFPTEMRGRLLVHYQKMADEAAQWLTSILDWNQSHPQEEPIDVEPLRLVNRGALEAVDALAIWGPIPERAVRMINSAVIEAVQEPRNGRPGDEQLG